MAFKFLILAICLAALTCAEYYNPLIGQQYPHKPQGYLRPAYHTPKEEIVDRRYHTPPRYNYEYDVRDPYTGDIKSQQEYRDGDVVKGYYSLNEPDGTKRLVRYKADPYSGFNADVDRVGHAIHPVPVKPVYKPIAAVPVKAVPVPVKPVVVPYKTVPVKTVPVAAKGLYPYGGYRDVDVASPVAYGDSYY